MLKVAAEGKGSEGALGPCKIPSSSSHHKNSHSVSHCEKNCENEKFFKEGEDFISDQELLRRQRKYALDKQFLFKLQGMCNRVRELRSVLDEAEKLNANIKERKEKDRIRQLRMLNKKKLRERMSSVAKDMQQG